MQTDKKQAREDKGKKPDKDQTAKNVAAAHDEAIHDIELDPDFSVRSPNDDLDEGETARLGEDKADLV